MKNIRIENPNINVRCCSGNTNIITVTADLLPTLEAIGRTLGIYHGKSRETRIIVKYDTNRKPVALVKEVNVAWHGTPCWETNQILSTDPTHIEAYIGFSKLLDFANKQTRS